MCSLRQRATCILETLCHTDSLDPGKKWSRLPKVRGSRMSVEETCHRQTTNKGLKRQLRWRWGQRRHWWLRRLKLSLPWCRFPCFWAESWAGRLVTCVVVMTAVSLLFSDLFVFFKHDSWKPSTETSETHLFLMKGSFFRMSCLMKRTTNPHLRWTT